MQFGRFAFQSLQMFVEFVTLRNVFTKRITPRGSTNQCRVEYCGCHAIIRKYSGHMPTARIFSQLIGSLKIHKLSTQFKGIVLDLKLK